MFKRIFFFNVDNLVYSSVLSCTVQSPVTGQYCGSTETTQLNLSQEQSSVGFVTEHCNTTSLVHINTVFFTLKLLLSNVTQ